MRQPRPLQLHSLQSRHQQQFHRPINTTSHTSRRTRRPATSHVTNSQPRLYSQSISLINHTQRPTSQQQRLHRRKLQLHRLPQSSQQTLPPTPTQHRQSLRPNRLNTSPRLRPNRRTNTRPYTINTKATPTLLHPLPSNNPQPRLKTLQTSLHHTTHTSQTTHPNQPRRTLLMHTFPTRLRRRNSSTMHKTHQQRRRQPQTIHRPTPGLPYSRRQMHHRQPHSRPNTNLNSRPTTQETNLRRHRHHTNQRPNHGHQTILPAQYSSTLPSVTSTQQQPIQQQHHQQ